MGLINLDIISTVVQRSVTGRPVPTGNTIIMQGGADIDNIIDKITADLRDKYLSKTTDDEALGMINFKPGLKIGGIELKYDEENNAVYIERSDGNPVNFYATGGLSMYGLGNTKVTSIMDVIEANIDPNTLGIVNGKLTVIGGGGSGGEGGITTVTKQMVIEALGFTPYSAENPNGYITAASIPSALKNPYALTFGSKTYDGSAAKSITASDLGAALSSDLSKYLPLTGGTISGQSVNPLTINSTNPNEVASYIIFGHNYTNKAYIGFSSNGAFIQESVNNNYLMVKSDGAYYNTNKLWHSGNLTKLSQLTDDVVSGKYLPLTGGTINGIIYLNHTLNQNSRISFKNNRTEESSSWAVNVMNVTDASSNVMMCFGIFGTKKVLDYIFLGHNTYTGNNLRVYTDKVTFGSNKIWHAGNDGSGSELDADLLDGKHNGELTSLYVKQQAATTDDFATYLTTYGKQGLSVVVNGSGAAIGNIGSTDTVVNFGHAESRLGRLLFTRANNSQNLFWQTANASYNGWGTKRQIAFIDSNVASSTKLQTARTIWGQSFDGSANIDGKFTIANNSTINSLDKDGTARSMMFLSTSNNLNVGYGTAGAGLNTYLYGNSVYLGYGTSRTVGLSVTAEGVGIGKGTKAPSYLLDVNGTALVTELRLRRGLDNAANMRFYSPTGSKDITIENASGDGHIIFNTNVGGAGIKEVGRFRGNDGKFIIENGLMLNYSDGRTFKIGWSNYLTRPAIQMWSYSSSLGFSDICLGTSNDSINGILYFRGDTRNWGIGTYAPDPSAKLHVNGKLLLGDVNGATASLQFYGGEFFDKSGNLHLGANSGNFNIYNSSSGVMFRIDHATGNIGVGTTSISAKLHVVGNILATGGVTMQSQRSLKNVVDERGLSLTELSNIKPTRYTWKDKRDDRIHFGGIADDIEKVLPEVIYKTSDGTLTMDYGNAGFAIASSLIKPVIDHEARIAALEKENEELKERLNRYEA